MKKIFTLILGAAMFAPMASADEVTMSICPYDGQMSAGYTIYNPVATGKGTVNYDETTKIYTMPNFMGYNGINLEFIVDPEDTYEVGESKFIYLGFTAPDGNSPLSLDGTWKLRINWAKMNGYVEGMADNTRSFYGSSVFTDGDDDYMFRVNGINACVEGKTAATAIPNIIKRSRAVKDGDGYKFFFQLDCPTQWVGTGDSFTYQDSMTLNGVQYGGYQYYLIFSYPENNGNPTGIEDIEAADENAPVEYFNLQGVRVENPENGLYIRRQGNTVSKVVL